MDKSGVPLRFLISGDSRVRSITGPTGKIQQTLCPTHKELPYSDF
jgi:hypothetical protein